ncbi:uncharacterized protein LOC129790626 [Lutzomyia longipalpis]|uniref:uncharacterized protein LOC129790626 n=1 Tax=Lutzomyia longipalpis TaxID=7200 RepID=UPI00248395A6|nr:uncharacterized protein LOC129790626 [Lutzomyia longipalpis]
MGRRWQRRKKYTFFRFYKRPDIAKDLEATKIINNINNNMRITDVTEGNQENADVDDIWEEIEIQDGEDKLTPLQNIALQNAAGKVAVLLRKKIKCESCLPYVLQDNSARGYPFGENEEGDNIQNVEVFPTHFILDICKITELYLRKLIETAETTTESEEENGPLKPLKIKLPTMVNYVINSMQNYAYQNDLMHFCNYIGHFTNFITVTVAIFAKVRSCQILRNFNDKKSLRQFRHRIIHFENQ